MIAGTSLFANNLCGGGSVGSVSGRISVTSVSSYLWIACKITYGVNHFLGIAYGVNQFLGITYGVNQFVGIAVYIIADCWLDRKSLELFHCFCMNVRSNLSLIFHVCIFPLCVDCDGELKKLSIVTLLTLCSAYFSSSSVTLLTNSWSFLLRNGVTWRSLSSSGESKIFVEHYFLAVAMHTISYDTSSLSKSFLPHSNTLKALK